MTRALKLYELTPSPNSVKIRIALGLKGLPYERIPIEIDSYPGDRSEVVRLSGQPRLPVLVHGDTVLFDSGAILRYLDANFRDTPPLYTSDFAGFAEIEEWEYWHRTALRHPVATVFGQALSGKPDPEICAGARTAMLQATERIEQRLGESPFLRGDAPSAPDVVCAAPVFMALLPPEAADHNPLAGVLVEHFKLGEGRDRTRAWAHKMMHYDEVFGRKKQPSA